MGAYRAVRIVPLVRVAVAVAVLVGVAASASAQQPLRPGPYIVELRAAMMGIPSEPAFFPPVTTATFIPARGFGIDVGAHVYPFRLGAAQLGLGLDVTRSRGTAADIVTTTLAISPQLSFNFGSRDGWSHLSIGYGTMQIRSSLESAAVAVDGGDVDTGTLRALNFGGGARWFTTRHFAATFDLRFYRVASSSRAVTPAFSTFAGSLGIGFR